jgi:rhamnose transport system permease protein
MMTIDAKAVKPPAVTVRPVRIARANVLLLVFLVEMVILCLSIRDYFSISGLLDAARTFVTPGMLALGMTLVIISGGIDLSVASLLALVSVTVGLTFRHGWPLEISIILGFVVGVAGGLLNGALIAMLELHPFVVTLATMALYRGAAYAISNAEAVSRFPDWFTNIGQFAFFDLIPAQLPVFVGVAVVVWLLLNRSRFGRYVYGVGANETVVRFSGVSVARTKLLVYGSMGALVSLAAIIETARLSTSRANTAVGLELPVIAMVVLGGTSINGGSGTIGGTILGILILSYLRDGLEFAGVRSDWGLIVVGVFLILGVFINARLSNSAR